MVTRDAASAASPGWATAPRHPAQDACPFLGLRQDARSRFAFPIAEHRCQVGTRPATIDLGHQGEFCLTDLFVACQRYTARPGAAAAVVGEAHETPPESAPEGPPVPETMPEPETADATGAVPPAGRSAGALVRALAPAGTAPGRAASPSGAPPPPAPVVWPILKVNALLRTSKMGSVMINNSELIVGDEIDGVRVTDIDVSMVTLQYKGETRKLRTGDITK